MAEENHVGEFLKRQYPEHGTLLIDNNGGLYTIIIDADMDDYVCKFNFDDCVEIDMGGYNTISLEHNTLIRLANLIEEAEAIYRNRTQVEWDSFPD